MSKSRMLALVIFAAGLFVNGGCATECGKRQGSGVYPHLATYNNEGECGTGAVVPWADRLWVISYGPHSPFGSSDKLYEITPELQQIIRPESVGGTPANRMIHRESNQLVIGPYLIDSNRNIRVIHPKVMPGRLTGNARHLKDPAKRIYYATMEEGLYDVDVNTLDVIGLIKDGNKPKPGQTEEKSPASFYTKLPGYHGKGLYSGQGRLVYANNGEQHKDIAINPEIPSGALAEWRGEGDWQMVRRNQFTEVTGPGGIYGNPNPDKDPVWSVGWDFRSLILMVLDNGKWHAYRLPKASHCYDGSHGWNTEWPRIRDVGEESLLMTMHGTFWKFPRTFTSSTSVGISPRSTYLKVVGDFCRWGDKVVLGCDDTAKSEFINKRKAKGKLAEPGRSHSNLWFIEPSRLDELGPALGRGAVWLTDPVKANEPSDAFLFAGYERRMLHVTHDAGKVVKFEIQVDEKGNGSWKTLRILEVPAEGYAWTIFSESEKGSWVRLVADQDCEKVSAFFVYSNKDSRGRGAASIFDGIAKPGDSSLNGGLLHVRGDKPLIRFAVSDAKGDVGCYEMDVNLKLSRADDEKAMETMKSKAAIPQNVLQIDAASILYVDSKGRWRIPKGDPAFESAGPLGDERICREVCTERDLFNAGGTFYELPAENAGGFAKVRPVATHNRRIKDYASYRGMMVISGIASDAKAGEHVVKSEDGKCALWVGVIDDLWKFGKPRGAGGPLKDTVVKAGEPSDPYLMTGFDKKSVKLSHDSKEEIEMTVEVDFGGKGWSKYKSFRVPSGQTVAHEFPEGFSAYWVRVVCAKDCKATAIFVYE